MAGALTATTNPLSPFSHGYRLAKMHGKLSPAFADQVEPYLFSAAGGPPALGKGEVTACMYTNDLWGSEVAEFVRRWGGPVSLVWETTAPRTAGDEGAKKARQDTIRRIAKLRDSDSLFRALVDVHLVAAPRMPGPIARRKREKMLTEPVATNHQLNIGRFFARTSVVWLVGDARIVPSHNLRVKLNGEALKRQVLEHGDALVVPTFGFIRPDNALKSFESFNANGSSADATFAEQARQYVAAHRTSISIPSERWPKTKRSLVTLTTRPSTTEPSSSDSGPLLGMHDESWDVGKGPTNWVLWRKYATDPRLAEGPELGGGAGLGVEGRIGGGSALYRVTAYDLHYAPNVVVSRQGQPWCTERFEDNKAACAYQMYLTGTELWVVPDEWAFTLKVLGSTPSTPTEAERLKVSRPFSPNAKCDVALIAKRVPAEFDLEPALHQVSSRSLHALRTRVPFGRRMGQRAGETPPGHVLKGAQQLGSRGQRAAGRRGRRVDVNRGDGPVDRCVWASALEPVAPLTRVHVQDGARHRRINLERKEPKGLYPPANPSCVSSARTTERGRLFPKSVSIHSPSPLHHLHCKTDTSLALARP